MNASAAGQAWALFRDVAAGRSQQMFALAAAMVGAGLAEGALLAVLPKLLQTTASVIAVFGFVALAAVAATLGLLAESAERDSAAITRGNDGYGCTAALYARVWIRSNSTAPRKPRMR